MQIQGGTFLPDGKRIVLCANEPGRPSRLFLQDVAGGDPRPISAEGVAAPWLTFPPTPDGAFVTATDKDGHLRFYPTAGGEPRELRGTRQYDSALAISNDGRHLFVTPGRKPGEIFRIDLARGVREPWRVVGREGSNPAAFMNNVVVSGDGTSFAYTFRDDTSTLYVAEGLR